MPANSGFEAKRDLAVNSYSDFPSEPLIKGIQKYKQYRLHARFGSKAANAPRPTSALVYSCQQTNLGRIAMSALCQ